jgi:hypothetical protein
MLPVAVTRVCRLESPHGLKASFRPRYEVYVDEYGRFAHAADHGKRELSDDFDQRAIEASGGRFATLAQQRIGRDSEEGMQEGRCR